MGSTRPAVAPICAAIFETVPLPPSRTYEVMFDTVQNCGAGEELNVVLVFGADGGVYLEPVTLKGISLVDDISSRVALIPCPQGECESTPDGTCKWCGGPRK